MSAQLHEVWQVPAENVVATLKRAKVGKPMQLLLLGGRENPELDCQRGCEAGSASKFKSTGSRWHKFTGRTLDDPVAHDRKVQCSSGGGCGYARSTGKPESRQH